MTPWTVDSVHGDSPGKNTGVGSHSLLQGIFPTQGLNTKSPALQADSLPFEPPVKPFPHQASYFHRGIEEHGFVLFLDYSRNAYIQCPSIT